MCLYDSDDENLISTIVLRTEDSINIIEDYFFKTCSTSYGMFEMDTIDIIDNYKDVYKEIISNNNKNCINIENSLSKISLKDESCIFQEKKKPILDKSYHPLQNDNEKPNKEKDYTKDKKPSPKTTKYEEKKSNNEEEGIQKYNNKLDSDIHLIKESFHKSNNIKDIKELEKLETKNFEFSRRACKDLLIQRRIHKCNLPDIRNSIDFTGFPSDQSFVFLTGNKLKKTESKGFNYIKFYVSNYFFLKLLLRWSI